MFSIFVHVDVNECMGKNPCVNNGTCSNTRGSYRCSCASGWTGKHCEEGNYIKVASIIEIISVDGDRVAYYRRYYGSHNAIVLL